MMAMNDLAGIYSQNGDYTTALDYYLKSRDILETIKPDATSLCIVYVNIAGIYNILDQPKQADEYLAKCYPLLDAAKPYLRYLYWQERQNLADKNKDAKMVLLTIDSLERSLKTSSLSEYEQNQYDQTLYEMRGDYQSNYQKNYPAAIESFQSMLRYANQMDDKPEIYNAQYEIGKNYHLNGDNLKAISFLEAAYNGAVADNVGEVVSRAAKLLADIY